jgi:1,4-dihydroxy-2-naphthoyl-CoA hydrolase
MTAEELTQRGTGRFPGLLGLQVLELGEKRLVMAMDVRPELLAPNGFLHAGSLVTLADTACGYGCIAHLPPGAENFTTLELKANFMATARSGTVQAAATLLHGGRSTQVWDARITQGDKLLALFRCSQMLLYPRA